MDASLNGPFGHITLSPDTLTIGRIPGNKLVINDSKASSRHAEIRLVNNGYILVDLGSTNGTFVNEQQLRPNEPRQLNTGDTIRIGDTRISYEASNATQAGSTVYAEPGVGSGYDPTIAVPPPAASTAYGIGQQNNQPFAQNPPPVQPVYGQQPMFPPPAPSYGQPDAAYPPMQPAPPYGYPPAIPPKKSNRQLFIILGSVVGGIILLCILASVVVYATRSTPDKTLNAYCDGIKSGDYQSAYNQLSQHVQHVESESQFASAFTATGVRITGCSVSNASENGVIGTGSIAFVTNNGVTGTDDYQLVQENSVWKINSGTIRK